MTETSVRTIPELNQQIDQLLDTDILNKRGSYPADQFLSQFADQGRQLAEAFCHFGDRHFALLGKEAEATPPVEVQRAFFVTYHWSGRAKAFLILWRDILFELQKGQILLEQGATTAENLDWLCVEAKQTLRDAAAELGLYLDARMQRARRTKTGMDKHLQKLRLQQNPWPVYREQLKALAEQLQRLVEQYQQLSKTGDTFRRLQEGLEDALAACRSEIDDHRRLARNTATNIENNADAKASRIAGQLEEIEAEIQLPQHITAFTDLAEQTIAGLSEKQQVPVATEGGLIRYKDINFRRSSRQWLDAEILPLLYEVWELTELDTNGLKMALLNIRNRSLLLASEQKDGKVAEFDRKDLVQPLQAFVRKSATTETEVQRLQDLAVERLQNDFQLSHVYQPTESFLPVPLQSTINKLRTNRNVIVTAVSDWWTKQSKAFRALQKTVEIEESLSISEKVVRYLQRRNWETTNTHYNSLFLTKGYIGESFWVGRTDELNHLQQLIHDWENGFRGAVALTGQRLSGRSLLGEVVANRFFPQRTIRLQPQSSITVNGRRLATTYDLDEALAFIRKNTLNKPHLVWIDDLELWRDPNVPLGKNINALRRFIDDYSNQLFFLIAMGNSLRHHLERFCNIGKVFQAEINLDRMPLHDVREAIMIRHGATHKELLDNKSREVNPQLFQQMTAKVHKAAHGNIGEALNMWAFSTHAVDEFRVIHDLKNQYELPDFVNPDNALLLTAIILSKKSNEYRLRKLFGPAFSEKYRGVLQRLISIGLLRREADGWLEVTESAANDLGRLLEKKQYLKFQR